MTSNGSPRDPQLVEKIVAEVKSQGVFDEFRRGSMADVDTKPAYQNLRQRVENTVNKFLSEQQWTPETNKNQLREKLRRYISESGFLDVGVERIVDQVVNPKIGAVFRPKIEEIAYKYLGIKPKITKAEPFQQLLHSLPPLPLNGVHLTVDTSGLLPTDLEQVSPDSDRATVKSELKDDPNEMDLEKTDDDDESPPFEPLENCFRVKKEATKNNDETDIDGSSTPIYQGDESLSTSIRIKDNNKINRHNPYPNSFDINIEKDTNQTNDANVSQESQLSHVSSKSYSIEVTQSPKEATVNISEEAQMPNFCDNSSDENVVENERVELHFDIKKDEIVFEGTERRSWSSSIPKDFILEKNFDADAASLKVVEEKSNLLAPNKSCTDFQFTESVDVIRKTPKNNKESTSSKLSTEDSNLLPEPFKNDKNIQALHLEQSSKTTTTETPPPPTNIQIRSTKDYPPTSPTSRHNKHKHSKDKYRSHEKDSRKLKEHERKSIKYGSNHKHTSSPHRRYHSSSSSHKGTKIERDSRSSSSIKNTTSSCSSSSRIEVQENRSSSRRDIEKSNRKLSSVSKTSSRKEKSDDHYEYKNKSYRRKSSDSNEDGDKSLESESTHISGSNSTKYKSNVITESSVQTSLSPKANDKTSDNCKTDLVEDQSNEHLYTNCSRNVVIVDELLMNTSTSFIELEGGCVRRRHTSSPTSQPKIKSSENSDVDENLLGFCNDPISNNELTNTIPILDSIKKKLHNILIQFCNVASSENDIESENEEYSSNEIETKDIEQKVRSIERIENNNQIKRRPSNVTNTDKMQTTNMGFGYVSAVECEQTSQKRLKLETSGCELKPSPTPSDTSVNSKENERIDKNNGIIKKTFTTTNDNNNKLCKQQRYKNEDLYKPRPVLSQRSRRRGIDMIN